MQRRVVRSKSTDVSEEQHFLYCKLLAQRPTLKLEDHPLSEVHDGLLNVFAATLLSEGRLLHPHPEDALYLADKGPT
jgi:hypothetical protein